jgi:hypothetical protein
MNKVLKKAKKSQSAEVRKFKYRLNHRHANFFQMQRLKPMQRIQQQTPHSLISMQNQNSALSFLLLIIFMTQAEAAFNLMFFSLNNQEYALCSKESPDVLYRVLNRAQRCPGLIANTSGAANFSFESAPVICDEYGRIKAYPSLSNPHPYHISPALWCLSLVFNEVIAEEDQHNWYIPFLFLAAMDIFASLITGRRYPGFILSASRAFSELPNTIFYFCPGISYRDIGKQFAHNVFNDEPYQLEIGEIDLEAGGRLIASSYGSLGYGFNLTG